MLPLKESRLTRRRVVVAATALFIVLSLSAASGLTSPASAHVSTRSAQGVPLSQSLSLRAGYYEGFEIDSFSNKTVVEYAASADAPVSTALMNGTQYSDFENYQSDSISNSITYYNGTSVQDSETLARGQYFLVFYSDYDTNIQYGFEVFPNTPFSYGPPLYPLASGITSFGIYNNSGVVTPYEIRTNSVIGVANISSFLVNTANASAYGDSVSGATLQLNTILVVQDKGGSSAKAYWVQLVPDFTTAAAQVSFGDEIWNFTDLAGFLSNDTVTSTNFLNGGFVYPAANGSNPVYNYNAENFTYKLPLNFGLIMNASVVPNTGVLVQLGYRLLSSGSSPISSPTNWYDNVTIHDTGVQSSYFDVAGNSTTPVGDFFDAELVFCGEGNLESANFQQLSAQLALFYMNSSSGVLTSYPSYYSFSGDTGEAAVNLVVGYASGIAQLDVGANPNYVYLGNASLTLGPDLKIHGAPAHLNFTTITAASTQAASTGNGNGSFPDSTTLAGIIVVVIVVVLIAAVLSSRRSRPTREPYYRQEVFRPPSSPFGLRYCMNCGTPLPENSRFCGNCGSPV